MLQETDNGFIYYIDELEHALFMEIEDKLKKIENKEVSKKKQKLFKINKHASVLLKRLAVLNNMTQSEYLESLIIEKAKSVISDFNADKATFNMFINKIPNNVDLNYTFDTEGKNVLSAALIDSLTKKEKDD